MSVLQLAFFLLPYCFLLFWLIGSLSHSLHWEAWGWICVAQVGMISIQRLIQAKRFGHFEAILLHPLSMLSLILIQWGSYVKSLQKKKVKWKGRTY